MIEVIGIRFKHSAKIYYFSPNHKQLKVGDKVIAASPHGTACGEVVVANQNIDERSLQFSIQPIIRIANEQDLENNRQNEQKEKEAFTVCEQQIQKHKLSMKLVSVEYTLDKNKLLFYFTSDGRVDFRALVKDLAGIFHTRIELRQIGVRDEARMLGGFGICGRNFCCSGFLEHFHPVSIKMAKEQNLSLNPAKISGACGRLMCCLKYEQDTYEKCAKSSPRIGSMVSTPNGMGTVVDGNVLTGFYQVRMQSSPDAPPSTFHRDVLKPSKLQNPHSPKRNPK